MVDKATIVYHLGAPHTDVDQITWSLRKDAQLLSENGVLVRRPGTYRKLIKGMRHKLEGRVAQPEEQDSLLTSIVRRADANRVILSDATILGMPAWIFIKDEFYHNAGRNTAEFRNLFPDHPVEFFLAIRNPATFLPEAFKGQTEKTCAEFFGQVDLFSVRWSDVIADIQHANPGTPITVWCNEESPIIWPDVLRSIADLDAGTRFQGELDIVRGLMSEAGIERLEEFLMERENLNESQRQRVRGIVLEKYAQSNDGEVEVTLPGWDDDVLDRLEDIYEDDIDEILEMPGVRFLQM